MTVADMPRPILLARPFEPTHIRAVLLRKVILLPVSTLSEGSVRVLSGQFKSIGVMPSIMRKCLMRMHSNEWLNRRVSRVQIQSAPAASLASRRLSRDPNRVAPLPRRKQTYGTVSCAFIGGLTSASTSSRLPWKMPGESLVTSAICSRWTISSRSS
jgi:hypothetical protein